MAKAAWVLACTLLGLTACAQLSDSRQTGPYEKPRPVEFSPTAARDWLTTYREGRGLGPVQLDGRLTAFAQTQADLMARRDVLSHSVDGESFGSRVESMGLRGRTAENVLYGAYTTNGAMQQWQRSPEHDLNLRMDKASRFGIAFAQSNGPKRRVYWAMAIAADPPAPRPDMMMGGPFTMAPVQRRVVVRRVRTSEGPGVLSTLTAPIARLWGE